MNAETRFERLGLFTDLYELTMLQAYMAEGMTGTAVFSLFVRRLPARRNFLVACGIDPVLAWLERLRFTEDDIAYLRSLGKFSDAFLDALPAFRFTGDVWAVPEGTPVFANEPILEIAAPIAEAQFVETLVMNQVHVQTVMASKAARVVAAAAGRSVVDFGARRTHGVDAAMAAARACYIAGADGTSNVLAGKQFGIPVFGTMAHSYVQAHEREEEAFRAFARSFPGSVILVDTYDTLEGVRRVIDLAKRAPSEFSVGGVRLDSGDLAVLARETRRLLDEAGLTHVRIIVSSGLDEERIASLLAAGAPIDGFGVGTSLVVSDDAPALDLVYKLAEYDGTGRTKLSADKPVLPGRKQVFRRERDGVAAGDVIGSATETLEGRALLRLVMRKGTRLDVGATDLQAIRRHAAEELAHLPAHLKGLGPADPPYPVSVSPALEQLHAEVRRTVGERR